MYSIFNEDADLLDLVEINSVLEQEVINETTIMGEKITKEKLEDKEFVKKLTKKIKDYGNEKKEPNEIQKFLNLLFGIIMIISAMTIVLIPVVLLICYITVYFSKYAKSKRDLDKLDDCIEKTINKLKKQMQNAENKKEYEDAIKKLEDNRVLIYDRRKIILPFEKIDTSKYNNGYIKLDKTAIPTISGELINALNSSNLADKDIENHIKRLDNWSKLKFTVPIDNIEEIAYYKINEDKLLKIAATGNNATGDLFNDWEDYNYSKSEYKSLNGKKLTYFYTIEGYHTYTYIVFCKEDNCFYSINFDYAYVHKITARQLIQVSNDAYKDLMAIIKEYENLRKK